MGHYERRLEKDLDRIRRRVERMGASVLRALSDSVQSVLELDPELAADTVLGDLPINRMSRDLDHLCHVFVARHLPSARHLRFITAALRLSKTLERIGDYAATISREVHQIDGPAPQKTADDILDLGRKAQQVLEHALESFLHGDQELAGNTRKEASSHVRAYDSVFQNLARTGESGKLPIPTLFALLTVVNRLERVIHQGKNIAEQAIFFVTGAQKDEKSFNILFLGNRNQGSSLMAELYCRRAYPEVGRFSSAGWTSVAEIPAALHEFADSKGFDLREVESVPFKLVEEELSEFDIVIDLTGKARENIRRIPFHTTLLVWNLDRSGGYESSYKDLVDRLAGLMSTLRGEEAED